MLSPVCTSISRLTDVLVFPVQVYELERLGSHFAMLCQQQSGSRNAKTPKAELLLKGLNHVIPLPWPLELQLVPLAVPASGVELQRGLAISLSVSSIRSYISAYAI